MPCGPCHWEDGANSGKTIRMIKGPDETPVEFLVGGVKRKERLLWKDV